MEKGSPPHLPRDPVSASLDEAIQSAPVSELRSLLKSICKKHDVARNMASVRLLAPAANGSANKRKAYEVCSQCGEDYLVEANVVGKCTFHQGECHSNIQMQEMLTYSRSAGVKKVDFESDMWADHDERCHGRLEDFKDDPEFSEGFIWSCCDQDGDAEGCRVTRHKPLADAKRARS